MKKIIAKFAISSFLLALASLNFAQPLGWNDPFPPHKIIDNLYYVGTTELASFLFDTSEGLILMSSNYESSVPIIKASVEELGFNFEDIKILISGHAHPDHIEGDALVKELTGAEVVVGRIELPVVRAATTPSGREQPVDRIVDEGDKVTLGRTTLTAHLQAGHTKGCLGWSTRLRKNGRSLFTFIECSLNGRYLQYVGNEDYPNIAEDLQETFNKARELQVDVFLSSHGQFYGMHEKYEKLIDKNNVSGVNPFIDPAGYKAHLDEFEQTFQETLAAQLAVANE